MELVLDPVVGCVVVFQKNAVVVLASSRCWFLTHGTGRWRVGRNRPLLDFTVKSKALSLLGLQLQLGFQTLRLVSKLNRVNCGETEEVKLTSSTTF